MKNMNHRKSFLINGWYYIFSLHKYTFSSFSRFGKKRNKHSFKFYFCSFYVKKSANGLNVYYWEKSTCVKFHIYEH